jgi:two-component system cell cycle response regulator
LPEILVIEDNAANLDLMIYILTAFGHTTHSARDGEEGLEQAASLRPDLIICDIQLPKADGYEVVRKLKDDPALCAIPVLAVTAFAMVGDRDRVLQAGFDGYLAKPIDPELFASQIDRWLSIRSSSAGVRATPVIPSVQQPGNVATVLAVDNVPANLELARSVLEPFGYRVITARSGRTALELARRERPDLILSDVCMADGSGYDFIQAVRADPNLSSVPFVFITASLVEEKDRLKGLEMGAARFLIRPMEPEKLLAEIVACLTEQQGDS